MGEFSEAVTLAEWTRRLKSGMPDYCSDNLQHHPPPLTSGFDHESL